MLTLNSALVVAAAILLHPFIDRIAARLLPRPNRAQGAILGLVNQLKPKIDSLLGVGDPQPMFDRCGDHHEQFNPSEDRTETHHCILSAGHVGDHVCDCGVSWSVETPGV